MSDKNHNSQRGEHLHTHTSDNSRSPHRPESEYSSHGKQRESEYSSHGKQRESEYSSHGNQRESEYSSHGNQRESEYSSHGNQRESEYSSHGKQRESDYSSHGNRRQSRSSSNEDAGSSQTPYNESKFETYPIELMKKEPECHMQLDSLSPGCPNHTVLINTMMFREGKIEPFVGQHVWHSNDVKLPQHYPSFGPRSRWEATQNALLSLSKGRVTAKDVKKAIESYNKTHISKWNFAALFSYTSKMQAPERNGFSSVIAKMAKLALRLPELIKHPIPLLKHGMNHSITMSQEQIACLLANAFFCTFPHRNTNKPGSEYQNYPTINFSSLFVDEQRWRIQKLRSIFHYFSIVANSETKPEGLVTFERIYIPSSELPNWKKNNDPLTNLHVSSEGLIEKEGKGMLQVDFCSKFIGGGVLGRGLVQEEIRFLQCPELIVARLFTEKLENNECLKITGVQTYSETRGYSDSFEWTGPHTDKTERDEWKRRYCQIVAIDAVNFKNPSDQYTNDSIKRELNKAYIGFRGDQGTPSDYTSAIATGNWGCGAFKGDPKLKAVIQMMAAAVAHRDLAYFTFGSKTQAQELQKMHDLLKTQKVTVGKLYLLLNDYCRYYSPHHHSQQNVFEFIKRRLSASSNL